MRKASWEYVAAYGGLIIKPRLRACRAATEMGKSGRYGHRHRSRRAGDLGFVTSSNQAGTAALLLVAAVFLLIGVQETALVRSGSGSTSVELDRRVAAAVQRADEVAEQDSQLALGILEGAAIIEPRVGPAAGAFRAMSYDSAVRPALERIKPGDATVTVAPSPADLAVISPAGSVLVSIVHRQSRRIQQVDLAPLVATTQLEKTIGGLFVANQTMTSSVVEYIATAARQETIIEAVTWKDPEDYRGLGEALDRLLKSRQRPYSTKG